METNNFVIDVIQIAGKTFRTIGQCFSLYATIYIINITTQGAIDFLNSSMKLIKGEDPDTKQPVKASDNWKAITDYVAKNGWMLMKSGGLLGMGVAVKGFGNAIQTINVSKLISEFRLE